MCYSYQNEICSNQQGGIILTKLVLDEIFLSYDIINTLKNSLKIFESKGLSHIKGENISIITKQLHVTVVCLDELDALPNETYRDILFDFTKCSNEDFKAVFKNVLTQERIDYFSSHSLISTSSYGSASSETTITKLNHILHDANYLYNNFASNNKWVVHQSVSACFNCGGDHGRNDCKNTVTKPALCRSRLSIKRRGIVN